MTTWYIAGNHIGPDGIAAVCQSLEHNALVDSLWLKRNPLKPAGCLPLAKLLLNNTKIEVLDLVNTGILDAGLKTVLDACRVNSTLRHLYVGTNGITSASGPVIRDFFASGKSKLISFYLSCNRLGDAGAIAIGQGLAQEKLLQRFSLASNRVTAVGLKAFLDAVKSHPALQLLDFGFTRSTAAVGELGNRLGDDGAVVLADFLRHNKTVRSLDVMHNNMSQTGVMALRDALRHNTTVTTLNHTQYGKLLPESVKNDIADALERNKKACGEANAKALFQIDIPEHISAIYSVYRTH